MVSAAPPQNRCTLSLLALITICGASVATANTDARRHPPAHHEAHAARDRPPHSNWRDRLMTPTAGTRCHASNCTHKRRPVKSVWENGFPHLIDHAECLLRCSNATPIDLTRLQGGWVGFFSSTDLHMTPTLGSLLPVLIATLVSLPPARLTWQLVAPHASTGPAALRLHAALGCGEEDDAWACQFGMAEASTAKCDFSQPLEASVDPHFVALAYARMILLAGKRLGLAPPVQTVLAGSDAVNGITVSVHVRMGDSCDLVVKNRLTHMWKFVKDQNNQIDYNRSMRYCVHPSVHLQLLQKHMHTEKVSTVLLATDSPMAAELFSRALSPTGVRLRMLQLNRSRFDYNPSRFANQRMKGWIDHRQDAAADGMVFASAIEDVRLLSSGDLLVAGLCSKFARMLWLAMVARQGRLIPTRSVDPCVAGWKWVPPFAKTLHGVRATPPPRGNLSMSCAGSAASESAES